MRYALDLVNKNNSELLFGMKARFRIVDTCRNILTLSRSFKGNLEQYYMGVIGPTTSDQGLLVSVVHGAHDATVVSPSATSQVFEDRTAYFNFFRTVPSDNVQVRAMIDVLSSFNWTYISIVYSYGGYGRKGTEEATLQFTNRGGCIARKRAIPMYPLQADYEHIIKDLASATDAKVVVLFTLPEDTTALLEAAEKLYPRKFTWVSSTGWVIDSVVPNSAAKGAILLRYKSSRDPMFENYFMNLTLKNNNYTWFREFWSDIFKCSIGKANDTRIKCSGNESLHDSAFQLDSTSVQPTLSAVDSIVCALRKSIIKRCPAKDLKCIKRVKSYTYHFEKDIVSFLSNGNTSCPELPHSVSMNQYGYYDRNIEIMNFDGQQYKTIGEWTYNQSIQKGHLSWTSVNSIVWNKRIKPKSFCYVPCEKGEIKSFKGDGCCYSCESCIGNDVAINNTCFACSKLEMPNGERSHCVPLPSKYMHSVQFGSYISMIFSLLGVAVNTAVISIFIKYRRSRIIKAASIELTSFIFAALYICFLAPLTYLASPSLVLCGLQRFIVGISLTGCYTPLMLKTNRIYRIFKAAETMVRRPVLVSSKSQILICLGLLFLQMLLGVMWVITEPPSVLYLKLHKGSRVAVICNSDTFQVVFNLIPALILMSVCTFYAYKTRRFPSNFNEALSIFTAMYISCFIWGIFITLIIFLEMDKERVFALWFTIANFTTVIGFVTLICLFGPMIRKIYTHHGVEPKREMFSFGPSTPAAIHRTQHLELNTLGTINEGVETELANNFQHNSPVITRGATLPK